MTLRPARLVALAFVALALASSPSPAADKKPAGHISVATTTDEDALKHRPVMVSILADGNVVQQEEIHLTSGAAFHKLPVGTYDVRVEGDGLVTLVKRGIQVRDDQSTNVIGGPMTPGRGVKTIEYATGGLSREELASQLKDLAARLDRIEAALNKLQPALATDKRP
jgi:hypothetical protein